MSERRLLEDELEVVVEPPDEDEDDEEELEPVEYLVEELELEVCLTSVPKSVQFEHTSSFAPSTLIVFGDDVSAPHISHWTMRVRISRRAINHAARSR
ncbi:hypothetical protein C493_07794 [Natronolimnohabitans innermongolicus JCM 12255]|uniref:Uncharacterized protein n=1 Tax=Natronolimnohabitans innermongolicus JCM 12255 TaxID=1227499 RepID=L9X7R7_9EURY|nr:hypothetical protein C493_07794 [Natronolimnohabitans innermongolicus JCM 12255]